MLKRTLASSPDSFHFINYLASRQNEQYEGRLNLHNSNPKLNYNDPKLKGSIEAEEENSTTPESNFKNVSPKPDTVEYKTLKELEEFNTDNHRPLIWGRYY